MAVTKIEASRQLQFNADVDVNAKKITNLANPSAAQDAATKSYVDGVATGLDIKASVRAASVGNITRSGTQTIDGVALSVGERVLLKNQTAPAENGIYVVASGAWSRATDADTSAEVTTGLFVFVSEGTTNGDTGWVLTTNDAITLDTTSLTFSQFSGAGTYTGGSGLTLTGGDFAVNVDANKGIEIVTDNLGIKLDGSSLSLGSGGIKVNTAKFIVRETPSGTMDGANVTFTLASTPVSGKEEVYLNGVLQEPGAGNDYTISAATITYLTAPLSTDRLRVSYLIA